MLTESRYSRIEDPSLQSGSHTACTGSQTVRRYANNGLAQAIPGVLDLGVGHGRIEPDQLLVHACLLQHHNHHHEHFLQLE